MENSSALALTLLSLFGTSVFLILAITGLGGFGAFFSHPPLVALTVVTIALAVAAGFSKGNLSGGEREDRSNRWVLVAFAILGFLLGYLPAYTDRLDFWTFGGDGMRWAGVIIYAAGGSLRLWPVFVLGRRFSGLVAIQPGHELVTAGPYRFIRHPSYVGLLVTSLGWALAFRSMVGVILVLVTLWPVIARIRAEEAFLKSQFGAEYEAYRSHTWRLIPGIY
ncbi:isoprenylcysteine carboxylmethyltransferase family protein [Rhizobium sp. BG4]|nr:isoprenylcysteine carboxylmethyltransferase family protein [Rhizobium sp. BG4]QRM44076.1 isoprenylcysteine carboxylmethyltransferase family protein [Rhizobium sp. BG4]